MGFRRTGLNWLPTIGAETSKCALMIECKTAAQETTGAACRGGFVVKPDRQAHLARLHLLTAQLVDQPCRLAQGKRQRRLIVRLIGQERRVAGNSCAALTSSNKRFIPLAVGKQPMLLAPFFRIFASSSVDGSRPRGQLVYSSAGLQITANNSLLMSVRSCTERP